jgi:hypothetical protein
MSSGEAWAGAGGLLDSAAADCARAAADSHDQTMAVQATITIGIRIPASMQTVGGGRKRALPPPIVIIV